MRSTWLCFLLLLVVASGLGFSAAAAAAGFSAGVGVGGGKCDPGLLTAHAQLTQHRILPHAS